MVIHFCSKLGQPSMSKPYFAPGYILVNCGRAISSLATISSDFLGVNVTAMPHIVSIVPMITWWRAVFAYVNTEQMDPIAKLVFKIIGMCHGAVPPLKVQMNVNVSISSIHVNVLHVIFTIPKNVGERQNQEPTCEYQLELWSSQVKSSHGNGQLSMSKNMVHKKQDLGQSSRATRVQPWLRVRRDTGETGEASILKLEFQHKH